MKIYDRKGFLELPSNTVYSKWTPCSFGFLEIKVSSPNILPGDNSGEHIPGSACHCNPVSVVQPIGDVLIIHNSFGVREDLELADEVLNK